MNPTIIDFKDPPKPEPKTKSKKASNSAASSGEAQHPGPEEHGDDDELAASLAAALRTGLPDGEIDDVLTTFGLDPDGAASEHLIDEADVRRLATKLSRGAPANAAEQTLEDLALEVKEEPADNEMPAAQPVGPFLQKWDAAISEASAAIYGLQRNAQEPVGGRLGQHMSLVAHTRDDGTEVASFVHWVNPKKEDGRIVNIDNQGRIITIVPLRNPQMDFENATLLFSDTGARGDRRLEKSIRAPAPAHPLKVLRMMRVAFGEGRSASPCDECGGEGLPSEGDQIKQCSFCLLSLHVACAKNILVKLMRRVPGTPRNIQDLPAEIGEYMCVLCKNIFGVAEEPEDVDNENSQQAEEQHCV